MKQLFLLSLSYRHDQIDDEFVRVFLHLYFSFFGGIGAFFIASVIIYRYFHGGYSEAKSKYVLANVILFFIY